MKFITLRNQVRLQPTKVMTFMKTKDSMQRWLGLLLGLCLISASQTYAQQRTGGNFGSFGGSASRSSGGTSGGGSTANSIYPNSTQLGTASLSVDPETRSVVVIADDETFEKINTLIARLDRPKPQVLIKVVFLEVTHSDDLDFGVEGSYSPNLGGNVITNNLASIFGLGAQGAAGSTIGQNTMPTGAGIYSIVGNDFPATVRAIASAQKVDVLSRPSIMVRNNQPATITVGQSVPLVTGVAYEGTAGIPVSTVTYQNVGIILQVTPFITSDGLVEMIVAPQISSLSTATVQISTNVYAPVINLRSASTVVVTPDGQTVIIGGLMETDKTVVDSKIPILGDIPLLGALFKRHQKDNTKTELLIFLTPHVVSNPALAASATSGEAKRADVAPKAFSEQELNKFFDTLPLKPADTSVKH
jgi:general secretion pathway protein D